MDDVETIPGFEPLEVEVNGARLRGAVGGQGSPVLLLHGFPQTHLAWRAVAPRLAERFRVVCPDLPGYGASDPAGDDPAAYAKRATAARMVTLMSALGHERFAVAGHDRGALVALRAALDHPATVSHLAVLDVLPGLEMWEALHGTAGVFAFQLHLLAQPGDVAERLLAAAPEVFFGHFLDAWSAEPGAIPPDVRAHYLAAAARPGTVRAICHDYRAGAFVDPEHDRADRDAGRRVRVPTLAAWQDPGEVTLPFDPAEVWGRWVDDLRTLVLRGGHFLPEDRPAAVADAVAELVGAPAHGDLD